MSNSQTPIPLTKAKEIFDRWKKDSVKIDVSWTSRSIWGRIVGQIHVVTDQSIAITKEAPNYLLLHFHDATVVSEGISDKHVAKLIIAYPSGDRYTFVELPSDQLFDDYEFPEELDI